MIGRASDFRRRLLSWYEAHQRQLPWRSLKPDPYLVLLSELMLQQTQVATVVPYFHRFLKAFPTIRDLAKADEQEVLRQWQGLGYYSRARNLLMCARTIVSEHGGKVPSEFAQLMELPGIGRYTAGAIASIGFGVRAPILDGNVARVLCRIDCIKSDPARDKLTQVTLWRRAEEILPSTRVGEFNSALMELGATVCTPRNPACLVCPVKAHCQAFAAGVQDQIPAPRKKKQSPVEKRWTFCVQKGNKFLIEQRPAKGRWANLWQFVTVEAGSKPAIVGKYKRLGTVKHVLTHRRYEFEAFAVANETLIPALSRNTGRGGKRKWVRFADLDRYPMSRPQLEIAKLARSAASDD